MRCFLRKAVGVAALAGLLFTLGLARASATLNDTFVGYPDQGWGDVIGDPSLFGISGAASSFDGHLMTVTINTNYDGPIDGTSFGDLLLNPTWIVGTRCTDAGCDNSGTGYQRGDWSYAVHLKDAGSPNAGAGFYALPASGADPVETSSVNAPGSWIYRTGQPVAINAANAIPDGAATASFVAGQPGTLTFTFAPPDSFLDIKNGWIVGYSFALSWAPTCANDIIQGTLSESGLHYPVPEPGSLLLLGTALLGLGLTRCAPRAVVRRALFG